MTPVKEYIKNVGKSFKYATFKYIEREAPALTEFAEVNGDLAKDAYKSIKDMKKNVLKVNKGLKFSNVYKESSSIFENALSDLKTGKFYNKEREEKTENEMFGFGEDDMSLDFLNEDESSTPSASDKALMRTTIDSNARSASRISGTMEASARYMVESAKANTNVMLQQMGAIGNTINSGLHGVAAGLDSLNSFNNSVMKTLAENSTQFFQTATNIMQENNAILKEIVEMQRNLYKAADQTQDADPINDIISGNGAPDLKKYGKQIMQNLKGLVSEKTGGLSDIIDANMLKMIAANPLQAIPGFVMSAAMGPVMKTALQNIGETLRGAFGTFVSKMVYNAKNSDNIGKELMGKLFGIHFEDKSHLETNNYKHQGPTPFDWTTKRSIVEVIPGYLSRIEAALTGGSAKVYDDKSGKWTDMSTLKRNYLSERKTYAQNAALNENNQIKFLAQESKLSEHLQKQLDDAINKITMKRFADGGWLDLSGSNKDKAARYGIDPKTMKVFEALYRQVDPHTKMNTSADILRSKNDYRKSLKQREVDNVDVYKNLFSGMDTTNQLTYGAKDISEMAKKGGMNLIESKDSHGMSIFDYLRNIDLNTSSGITKGKKTYSALKNYNSQKRVNMRSGAAQLDHDISYDRTPGLLSDAELSHSLSNISTAGRAFALRRRAEKLEKNRTNLGSMVNELLQDEEKTTKVDQRGMDLNQRKSFKQGMSKLLSAATAGEKFEALTNSISKLTQKPSAALASVIETADKHIYDAFFEDDRDLTSELKEIFTAKNGKKAKGFFGKLQQGLGNLFINMKKNMEENETGKHRSMFEAADKTMKDLLGFNMTDIKDETINSVKNSIKQSFTTIARDMSKTYASSKKFFKEDEALPTYAYGTAREVTKSGLAVLSAGEYVIPNPDANQRKRDKANEDRIRDEVIATLAEGGQYRPGGKSISFKGIKEKLGTKASSLIGRFKKSKGSEIPSTIYDNVTTTTNEFMTELFGDNAEEVKKNVKQVQNEVRQHIPQVASGGIIGLVGGSLIGGPLIGAMLGSAISIAKNSETIQKGLFGERIYDENGNDTGKRTGGIISQATQEAFKKYAPDMKAYGIAGGLAGLFTPLGPLGGVMIGSAIGFAKNNETIQNMLFGENGLINDETKKMIKKYFPGAAKGAAGGAFLSALFAGSAVMPGMLPMAIIGAGIGITSTSDEFKDFLLGTKDSEGKRVGGLAQGIRDAVLNPLQDLAVTIKDNFFDWFKDDMVKPVANAMAPLGKSIEIGMKNVMGTISSAITGLFDEKSGLPFLSSLRYGLLGKGLGKGGGLINGLASTSGYILSRPSAMIGKLGDRQRMKHIQSGNATYMTAAERRNFMGNKGKSKYNHRELDDMLAGATAEELEAMKEEFGALAAGNGYFDNEIKSTRNSLGNEILHLVKDTGRAAKIMKAIQEGDTKTAQKLAMAADISASDKKKLTDVINKQGGKLRLVMKKKERYQGKRGEILKQLRKKGFTKINEKNIDTYTKLFNTELDARRKAMGDKAKDMSPEDKMADSITGSLDTNFSMLLPLVQQTNELLANMQQGDNALSWRDKRKLKKLDKKGYKYSQNKMKAVLDNRDTRAKKIRKNFGSSKLTAQSKDKLMNDDLYTRMQGIKDYDIKDLNEVLDLDDKILDRYLTLAEHGYVIKDANQLRKFSNKEFDRLKTLTGAGIQINDLDAVKSMDDLTATRMAEMYEGGINNVSQRTLQKLAEQSGGLFSDNKKDRKALIKAAKKKGKGASFKSKENAYFQKKKKGIFSRALSILPGFANGGTSKGGPAIVSKGELIVANKEVESYLQKSKNLINRGRDALEDIADASRAQVAAIIASSGANKVEGTGYKPTSNKSNGLAISSAEKNLHIDKKVSDNVVDAINIQGENITAVLRKILDVVTPKKHRSITGIDFIDKPIMGAYDVIENRVMLEYQNKLVNAFDKLNSTSSEEINEKISGFKNTLAGKIAHYIGKTGFADENDIKKKLNYEEIASDNKNASSDDLKLKGFTSLEVPDILKIHSYNMQVLLTKIYQKMLDFDNQKDSNNFEDQIKDLNTTENHKTFFGGVTDNFGKAISAGKTMFAGSSNLIKPVSDWTSAKVGMIANKIGDTKYGKQLIDTWQDIKNTERFKQFSTFAEFIMNIPEQYAYYKSQGNVNSLKDYLTDIAGFPGYVVENYLNTDQGKGLIKTCDEYVNKFMQSNAGQFALKLATGEAGAETINNLVGSDFADNTTNYRQVLKAVAPALVKTNFKNKAESAKNFISDKSSDILDYVIEKKNDLITLNENAKNRIEEFVLGGELEAVRGLDYTNNVLDLVDKRGMAMDRALLLTEAKYRYHNLKNKAKQTKVGQMVSSGLDTAANQLNQASNAISNSKIGNMAKMGYQEISDKAHKAIDLIMDKKKKLSKLNKDYIDALERYIYLGQAEKERGIEYTNDVLDLIDNGVGIVRAIFITESKYLANKAKNNITNTAKDLPETAKNIYNKASEAVSDKFDSAKESVESFMAETKAIPTFAEGGVSEGGPAVVSEGEKIASPGFFDRFKNFSFGKSMSSNIDSIKNAWSSFKKNKAEEAIEENTEQPESKKISLEEYDQMFEERVAEYMDGGYYSREQAEEIARNELAREGYTRPIDKKGIVKSIFKGAGNLVGRGLKKGLKYGAMAAGLAMFGPLLLPMIAAGKLAMPTLRAGARLTKYGLLGSDHYDNKSNNHFYNRGLLRNLTRLTPFGLGKKATDFVDDKLRNRKIKNVAKQYLKDAKSKGYDLTEEQAMEMATKWYDNYHANSLVGKALDWTNDKYEAGKKIAKDAAWEATKDTAILGGTVAWEGTKLTAKAGLAAASLPFTMMLGTANSYKKGQDNVLNRGVIRNSYKLARAMGSAAGTAAGFGWDFTKGLGSGLFGSNKKKVSVEEYKALVEEKIAKLMDDGKSREEAEKLAVEQLSKKGIKAPEGAIPGHSLGGLIKSAGTALLSKGEKIVSAGKWMKNKLGGIKGSAAGQKLSNLGKSVKDNVSKFKAAIKPITGNGELTYKIGADGKKIVENTKENKAIQESEAAKQGIQIAMLETLREINEKTGNEGSPLEEKKNGLSLFDMLFGIGSAIAFLKSLLPVSLKDIIKFASELPGKIASAASSIVSGISKKLGELLDWFKTDKEKKDKENKENKKTDEENKKPSEEANKTVKQEEAKIFKNKSKAEKAEARISEIEEELKNKDLDSEKRKQLETELANEKNHLKQVSENVKNSESKLAELSNPVGEANEKANAETENVSKKSSMKQKAGKAVIRGAGLAFGYKGLQDIGEDFQNLYSFDENDIQYLMDQGYSRSEAMNELSKSEEYKNKRIDAAMDTTLDVAMIGNAADDAYKIGTGIANSNVGKFVANSTLGKKIGTSIDAVKGLGKYAMDVAVTGTRFDPLVRAKNAAEVASESAKIVDGTAEIVKTAETGAEVGKTVEAGAEAVKTGTAAAEESGKIMQGAKTLINKLVEGVSKACSKVLPSGVSEGFLKLAKIILDKLASKTGMEIFAKWAAKCAASLAARAAIDASTAGIGEIVNSIITGLNVAVKAVFAVDGAMNSEKILPFKWFEEHPWIRRGLAAILNMFYGVKTGGFVAKIATGVSSGLKFDIASLAFSLIPMLFPLHEFTRILINCFGPSLGMTPEDIQEANDAIDGKEKEDENSEDEDQGIFDSIWNGITDLGDTVANGAKALWDAGGEAVDWISDQASSAWNATKEVAGNFADGVADFAGNAWNSIKDTAGSAWNGIKDTAGGAWDALVSGGSAAKDWIFGKVESFKDWGLGVLSLVLDKVFSIDFIKNIFGIEDGKEQDFTDTIVDKIDTVLNTASDFVFNPVDTIIKGAKQFIEWIPGTLQSIAIKAVSFFTGKEETADSIEAAINNEVEYVKNSISNEFDYVTNTLQSAWGSVTNVVDQIGASITNEFTYVYNTFSGIWNKVSNTIDQIGSSISNGFNYLYNTASNIWSNVTSSVEQLVTPIINQATGVFSSISNSITSVVSGATQWFENKKNAIAQFLGQIPTNFVGKTFEALIDKALDFVPDIVKNNVLSGITSLKQFFSGVKSTVVDDPMNRTEQRKQNQGSGKWGRGPTSGFHSQLDPANQMDYNISADTEHQTMADSGCLPASIANIGSAYGLEMDPKDIAKEGLRGGYKEINGGTRPGLATNYLNKYGLSTNRINTGDIADSLRHGDKLILMGTDDTNTPYKDMMGQSDTPFGTNPHYVAATDIDDNGNVTVQDPQSTTPNKVFNINDLEKSTTYAMATHPDYGKGRWGKGDGRSVYMKSLKDAAKENTKNIKNGLGKWGRGDNKAMGAEIYAYLKSKGLSSKAIAGIMGNFQAESGLIPTRVQGDGVQTADEITIDGKTGYGLAQWTYITRQQGLADFAKARGTSTGDYKTQLDYLLQELDTNYKGTIEAMDAAGSNYDAAIAFHDRYEGSADDDEMKKRRGNYAEEIAKTEGKGESFNGTYTGSGGSGSSSGGSSDKKSYSGLFGAFDQMSDFFNQFLGGDSSSKKGSSSGSMASGDIKAASAWAESKVGQEGYGNNGCTAFVRDYLLKANNDLGKYMSNGSQGNLMWVPTLEEWAKEKNLWKSPTEGGAEGDVVVTYDGGHVTIADGKGGTWGNSSSANKILHYPSISGAFGTPDGYISTGSGDAKVSLGDAKRSKEEMLADAGTSNAGGSKWGYGKWGRGSTLDEDPPFASIASTLASKVGSQHPELFWAQMMLETGGPAKCKADAEKYGEDYNYGGFTWYEGMGEEYKGVPRPANEGGYYAKFHSDAEYADMEYNKVYKSYADQLKDDETPTDFAHTLKVNGYYAADEGQYASGLSSILEANKDKISKIKGAKPLSGGMSGGGTSGAKKTGLFSFLDPISSFFENAMGGNSDTKEGKGKFTGFQVDYNNINNYDEAINAIRSYGVPLDGIPAYNKPTRTDGIHTLKNKVRVIFNNADKYKEAAKKKGIAKSGIEDEGYTESGSETGISAKLKAIYSELGIEGEGYTESGSETGSTKPNATKAAIELQKQALQKEYNSIDPYGLTPRKMSLGEEVKYRQGLKKRKEEIKKKIAELDKQAAEAEKAKAKEIAPNGKPFEENDIKYLMDNGYTREDAIKLLSQDPKYTKKDKTKETAPNGKRYEENDIKYLMDNGYTEEDAIKLLSQDPKYTKKDKSKSSTSTIAKSPLPNKEKMNKDIDKQIIDPNKSKSSTTSSTSSGKKELAKEIAPNGKPFEENDIKYLMDKGYTRESAINYLSQDSKYKKTESSTTSTTTTKQQSTTTTQSNSNVDKSATENKTTTTAVDKDGNPITYEDKLDAIISLLTSIATGISSSVQIQTASAKAQAENADNNKATANDTNVWLNLASQMNKLAVK